MNQDRWTRPLTGDEMLALLAMWCAITGAVIVAVSLFL